MVVLVAKASRFADATLGNNAVVDLSSSKAPDSGRMPGSARDPPARSAAEIAASPLPSSSQLAHGD